MRVRSPGVRCIVGLIVALTAATAAAGVRQKAKQRAPAKKQPAQSVAQQMPVQAQFAPVQAKTRQSPKQDVRLPQTAPRTQGPAEHSQPQKPARPAVAERVAPPTPTPPVAPRPPTLPVSAARERIAPVRPAIRYGSSVVTLDNQSGQPALVRLVGPTRAEVLVPAGGRNSVRRVAGGHYTIYARYGVPGNYRHTRGDSFDVRDGGLGYSRVTITLHTIPAGNYAMHGSSVSEFSAAAP